MAAVVIYAGGMWVVLPEKRRLEQVQCQFNAQCPPPRADRGGISPSSSAQRGEPGRRLSAGGAGTLPPPNGGITGAVPAVENNHTRPVTAADAGQRRCQRLAQDPLSLFMTPGHDPPAGLCWRATPAGGHGDRPGWTVAVTTDFAGFERLLSAIAALNGCIGLQALSLKATPEGLMLDFRLTRADESTPAVEKENDDGEMPDGA
ncbi:MAG: hypothetical protein ACMX3H_11925 [Sodalis sp. (in: enterobacteria)]|uniref:hypothetical protein n=1 Tax=Sodalis sp. (in: enterobacteria) TaxID=1898979 RepID=UPI0039E266D3